MPYLKFIRLFKKRILHSIVIVARSNRVCTYVRMYVCFLYFKYLSRSTHPNNKCLNSSKLYLYLLNVKSSYQLSIYTLSSLLGLSMKFLQQSSEQNNRTPLTELEYRTPSIRSSKSFPHVLQTFTIRLFYEIYVLIKLSC